MNAYGQRSLLENILGITMITAKIKDDRLKGVGEFTLFSMLSFFVPFLLSNQILVGIAVNTSLIGGAMYMKGRNLLPVIILPSLGLLARGIIFGPITLYLLYMLPFIWIGNAVLILSLKLFHLKMKKSYLSAALAGSVLKTALLFSSAFILYSLGIIPAGLLAAMGIMQLITAVSASVAFLPAKKMREK